MKPLWYFLTLTLEYHLSFVKLTTSFLSLCPSVKSDLELFDRLSYAEKEFLGKLTEMNKTYLEDTIYRRYSMLKWCYIIFFLLSSCTCVFAVWSLRPQRHFSGQRISPATALLERMSLYFLEHWEIALVCFYLFLLCFCTRIFIYLYISFRHSEGVRVGRGTVENYRTGDIQIVRYSAIRDNIIDGSMELIWINFLFFFLHRRNDE